MSTDVEQFIENLLCKRTFCVYTTPNNVPFEKCFDFVLTVFHDDLNFNNQAVVLNYEDCVVIELSKEMKTFLIVIYEGAKTSAMLVDKHFPDTESLVELLNQCMLTLWTPVETDSALLCGILIAFTDGSLTATAKYSNEYVRISLTFQNIFVEQVLLDVKRDDHLESGLPLLQHAIQKHLRKLKLDLPKLKQFKVEHHLVSSKDEFKLFSAADSILFVKFLADFVRVCDSRHGIHRD